MVKCGLSSILVMLASLLSSRECFPQAIETPLQILLQAKTAFAVGRTVSSVQLHGSARVFAGGTDETASLSATANDDGSWTLEIKGTAIERIEEQSSFASGQQCSWNGNDGVAHVNPRHNCMLPMIWLLPESALFSSSFPATGQFLSQIASATNVVSIHWDLPSPPGADAVQAALIPHISSFDLEFDNSTFLPASLSYNSHPDSNANIDIPVRIAYADYRNVNGVEIPFHVQRFLNGVLSMDISLTNAVISQ